jgi:hypothetical protein
MIGFMKFLNESLDVDKLKHLEHAEDHIIHGGDEGVAHAADNLEDLHTLLSGGKPKSKITTKYDGSPSVVFGVNPENGKFFVASKSAFNKNPKINYTDQDIENNHGHAPGLVAKLKAALAHLPKVMPAKGGVYQGDFLYEKPDVEEENGKLKFAPNTITYSANKDSAQGRKIAASDIGFVVHTQYKGKRLDDMKAGFDVDHSKFKQDPAVNLVNPEVNDLSNTRYTPQLRAAYQEHKTNALEAYQDTTSDTFARLAKHDQHLKPYINSTVRDGTTPSVKGYLDSLFRRRDIEVSKVKSQAGKDKKAAAYNELIDQVNDNHDDFDNAFKLHHHLQKAKDTLVQALGNPTEFEHTVGGKQVKPEGFVSIRNGRPTKLVDRAEFSRLNFANNRGKGDPDATPPPSIEKHHVFAFGRMNPPTVGHGALVDKVKEIAKANNADHSIVLSNSQDPEKNPLSPEQKLKHAKRFFPGTNIDVADAENPTFLHQLKKLHQQGVTHATMIAGSDRVDEYKKLLDKYNGPNGEFNFKKINVVSAGERDPDAEGVSGMSASKMRGHAMDRNYNEFRKGIPSHVSPEHAEELYNDVRKAMDIDIGPETSGISLGRYAKRNDVIGFKARKEIERREALKPKKKPKIKLTEDTNIGDVRGLGHITGDPKAEDDTMQQYLSKNIADADTQNNILNRILDRWHLRARENIKHHGAGSK